MTPATCKQPLQVRRALARCHRERRKACRYLRKGGPEALGALMGWADWTIEMEYIRAGCAEVGHDTQPAGNDTGDAVSCKLILP